MFLIHRENLFFLTSSGYIEMFYLYFHNIYYLVTKAISSTPSQNGGTGPELTSSHGYTEYAPDEHRAIPPEELRAN